jgi:TM2 domain-containing membrane protein YozV
MASANTTEKTPPVVLEPSALAGLLSYLVPGLGQIYQGRVGKGVLFMVCLYGLFFYGMALGSWKNVYYRDQIKSTGNGGRFSNIVERLPFYGQFPIGVAAWPALWQSNKMPMTLVPARLHNFMKQPEEQELQTLQSEGDKFWDLGQIYTIIAGVLNLLVIYDAFAGPSRQVEAEPEPTARREEGVPA